MNGGEGQCFTCRLVLGALPSLAEGRKLSFAKLKLRSLVIAAKMSTAGMCLVSRPQPPQRHSISELTTPSHAAVTDNAPLQPPVMVVQQHVLNWLYSVLTSVRFCSSICKLRKKLTPHFSTLRNITMSTARITT